MGALKRALLLAALSWTVPASADPVEQWAAQISEASQRFAVPEHWIRQVMRTESRGLATLGGRPTISSAGAMGLMQLMPETWREVRAMLGLGFNPHEPRDNILAGTFYLRAMYDRFGYPGLFAAYNAGPGRYAAFLDGRSRLPAETRSYMSKVSGMAMETHRLRPTIAANPSQPGPSAPFAPDGRTLFVKLNGGPSR